MDSSEFRRRGKEMVDYIADYYDNIRDHKVSPEVKPGYLRELLPAHAPEKGESWDDIIADVNRVIMPGVTHWMSPRFHGYYSIGGSYPSLMGDMLCDALSNNGFSWAASPACTELEMLTTDWIGDMLGLPKPFLHSEKGQGGGVIQTTASETVLLCLLAARDKKVAEIKNTNPEMSSYDVISKLICYSSDQANSSVPRSGLLASIKMRALAADETFRLDGETVRQAVREDKAKGLIPFFICATLGTTPTCSFDDIANIGPFCTQEKIWLHIDAAYAGSAFACPEFRYLMEGVQHAETFTFNPHKLMLTHLDLSVMWIQHSSYIVDTFNVDPIYLKHQDQGKVPDYRHWQIALSRRFRSLKLWFVLRSFGVQGIQEHVRKHISRAHLFADFLRQDGRFEFPIDVIMGLVCFRVKGSNLWSQRLYSTLNEDRRIYLTPANYKFKGQEVFFLRYAVSADPGTPQDVAFSFKVLKECLDKVLGNITLKELLATQSPSNNDYKPLRGVDASGKTTTPARVETPLTRESRAINIEKLSYNIDKNNQRSGDDDNNKSILTPNKNTQVSNSGYVTIIDVKSSSFR